MTTDNGVLGVLILGGGGHAKGLIEALRISWPDAALGVLSVSSATGATVLDVPVVGPDDFLDEASTRGYSHFVVGLGGVGDNHPRRRLFERGRTAALEPLTVIHPSAVLARSAVLSPGVQCLFGAIVGADAQLGENVIVNSGAVVEHDCRIGAHAHIASGAVLAGTVTVDEYSHVGAGAVVLQGMRIGRGAIVGAGAVVIRAVEAGTTVYGVPARRSDELPS